MTKTTFVMFATLLALGAGAYIYGMNIAGPLVGSFPVPGGPCRAVGFDGNYLWTADGNTPQYIYKVDIDGVDVEPGSFGKINGMYRKVQTGRRKNPHRRGNRGFNFGYCNNTKDNVIFGEDYGYVALGSRKAAILRVR